MISHAGKIWFRAATLILVCTMSASQAQEHHESDDEHEASSNAFRLETYRAKFFRMFLPDANDDADTLGQEFVSTWGWGNYKVTNISYIEFADYPLGVPGLPPGNSEPARTRVRNMILD